MGWPPSSAAATSIEIRVLVEGFSKIMARLFPCRGRPWPPRLPLPGPEGLGALQQPQYLLTGEV